MSKLDVGVGDEFPLDEPSSDVGHHHRRHRHGHHHMRHGRHHHGRRHHGFGRLPFLLILAGVIALLVEHKFTPDLAYGFIGAGVALIAMRFMLHVLWHWRHRRAIPSQAL